VTEALLRATDIVVQFGGLTAVDRVSVEVGHDDIVGIIGPNGAGKSTLFGAVLGTVGTAGGRVTFRGTDITGWPPHRRARAGIGRTFQKVELFGSMTVRENLEFATEAPALGAKPWRLLSRDRHVSADAARDIARRLDLEPFLDETTASLPIGQQRLVEFGRALCAKPSILLLDEPSSGLDDAETRAFGETIARTASADGIAVVLVEHDMNLVLSVCERIYVLEFGKLIASGTPSDIQQNPAVREAYLGVGGDL
jgi:branched-chain amino acid transport system ATP-binding protein